MSLKQPLLFLALLLLLPFTARSDNAVHVWGQGFYGQLANGQVGYTGVPAQVGGLAGLVAVAAGRNHQLAVRNDGTVWAWGRNETGQLGDGTTVGRDLPVQTIGISGVVTVGAGHYHSLAVKSDGTVWSWGDNSSGQLGDGTTISRTTPVQVTGLTGVTAVAGGVRHSLALRNDGTVWIWGVNTAGQLGTGNGSSSTTVPVQVPGLAGVIAIGAETDSSLAVKSDGTLWTWGDNTLNKLGSTNSPTSSSPLMVSGLTGVVHAAFGFNHGLAVKSDGSVWSWGYNYYGQLGIGSTGGTRSTPVQVTGITNAVRAAGGRVDSLVLRNDGSVWGFGGNLHGQFGNGAYADSSVPVATGLNGVSKLSIQNGHAMAVKADGTVWTWGENFYGELANGAVVRSASPLLTGVNGAAQVVTGWGEHCLAMTPDGVIWGWGDNEVGQLALGTKANATAPLQVTSLPGAIRLGSGGYHALAVMGDGSVRTWGSNAFGQLGNGTRVDSTVPVTVSGLIGVSIVSGGYGHSLAVKTDGTVWAWGWNGLGQIGDNTLTDRLTPVQVSGLTGVVAVAGGLYHSLALKSDGTVWAWGNNGRGQLGTGDLGQKLVPNKVSGLSGVVAIATTYLHNYALKSDGTVWAWGANPYGQLGDGTTTDRLVPMQVQGLADVVSIAAGEQHGAAAKSDGTVWAWGRNLDGELGDGTLVSRKTPVQSGITGVHQLAAAGYITLAFEPASGSNHAPTANAGSDITVTVPHDGDPNTNTAAFTLDGSASSDPDPGDTLTYEWKDGSTVVGTSAKVNLSRAAGNYTFTLKVTDNHGASSSDTVSVTVNSEPNSAPTANAGSDQTILVAGPSANVILSGSGSDPDNDTLSYSWSEGGTEISTGASPTVSLSSGSHTLKLTVTDPYGAAGTDTVSISVKRYTALFVPDVSGYAGEQLTLQAKLTVQTDGTPISSQPITFHTGGVNIGQATTDAQGIGRLSYSIPAGALLGTQSIDVSFAGSANYDVAAGSGTLSTEKKPTLTAGTASGTIDATVDLKATLKYGTTPLPSRTIRFKVDGAAVGTGTTDTTGVALLAYKLIETVGKHTLVTEFDGDNEYAPISSAPATLTVNFIRTTLAVSSITASPNQTVNLKVTLKAGTTLLASQTVSFKIDGAAVGSATTNSSGVALLAHTVTETPGIHTITAEYAGDGVRYAAVTGSGKLTVLIPTKIVADNLKAPAGSSVVFGAKLLRTDTLAPLQGKTLNFYQGTTLIGSGMTDVNGRATITTTAPSVGIKESIAVKFPGDSQFKAASGTGSVTGI